MTISESKQNLTTDGDENHEDVDEEQGDCFGTVEDDDTLEIPDIILTATEKKFLLSAERGDCGTVRSIIEQYKDNLEEFNINCVDPLNRTALISAIENENIELIKLLLEAGIKVKDALLHAIKEEYVEAVETLIKWEEQTHVQGDPYSWEVVDRASSTFTPDITPLILAAHRNHYEILKLLLDRGATLPMPHDVRCGCDDCVQSSEKDSLRHSQSRINAYKALSASSLISLSSRDPILTAFELSWELRRLSRMETEFRVEYNQMRKHCQEFATALLDHARTSFELGIMLNYNPNPKEENWEPGERQTLERLKLAIKYKQKMFVAHPNVQQLLAAIWYEGLPGFRRKGIAGQMLQVAKFGMMFPFFSFIYMVAPHSKFGKFMKKPFVKFICHSSSYAVFLMLLGAASQRLEHVVLDWIGIPWTIKFLEHQKKYERGSLPGFTEVFVLIYVISLIWHEIRSLWIEGLVDYIADLWNIVDFISNFFYVMWITLRFASWYMVQRDAAAGLDPWLPRESWDQFDPMLLSEGAFAAGMIFSFLKLVHIFSINPHLGPLQVSLGRMIIDIIKFFFIYTLVLFAFGCGLNQLLWYYADLERDKCYHIAATPDIPDFDNHEKSCSVWRRFSNLFETSQSLFWASFGLVDLLAFELQGIKSFTRFWALLMFGSYSVINIIVLLNMLIAMMSNSYQIISERSDIEWKFARSQLWMSYFEDGDTVPPPFNIMPTMKIFFKMLGVRKCGFNNKKSARSFKKSMEKVTRRHDNVMRLLVRRYITAEQRKRDDFGITEDDVMEIRQDISTLRFELIDILHQNGMKTPRVKPEEQTVPGKKGRVMERRILKDFQIGFVEGIVNEVLLSNSEPKDVFSTIAKVIGRRATIKQKPKDWNALVRKNTIVGDPIGSTRTSMIRKRRRSLRKQIIQSANEGLRMDTDRLVEYNPKLLHVTPVTRVAYVKFMAKKLKNEIDCHSDRGSVRSNSSLTSEKSSTVEEDSTNPSATTSGETFKQNKVDKENTDTQAPTSTEPPKLNKNETLITTSTSLDASENDKVEIPVIEATITEAALPSPSPPIVKEFRVQSPILEDPNEDRSITPVESTGRSPSVRSSDTTSEKPDGEISIISDGKDAETVKFTPTTSQSAVVPRPKPKPRKAGNWL